MSSQGGYSADWPSKVVAWATRNNINPVLPVATVYGESGGNPGAEHNETQGGGSWGIFQIYDGQGLTNFDWSRVNDVDYVLGGWLGDRWASVGRAVPLNYTEENQLAYFWPRAQVSITPTVKQINDALTAAHQVLKGNVMSVFDGVLVYIHDIPNCEGGNIPAIVSRLKEHNCAGVMLKVTDGNHGYNNWSQVKLLIDALKASSLNVVTWGYNYGYDPVGEANAAVTAIRTFNPDAHSFDTEIEMETLPNPVSAAMSIINTVKAAFPNLPFAHAPVSNIQGHLRCPYRQFTDAGFVMIPQTYYVAYGWTPTYTLSSFYAAIAEYDLGQQPIFPTYEDSPLGGYGSTTAQLQEFLSQLPKSVTGLSVWVYDLLDEAGWGRVSLASAMFPAPVGPTLVQQLEAKIATLELEVADDQTTNTALTTKIQSAITILNG